MAADRFSELARPSRPGTSRNILLASRPSNPSHSAKGASVGGGAFVGAPTPLKEEPTYVTKADVMDYFTILYQLANSLQEDISRNTVWMDPDVEQQKVDTLLVNARRFDGCEGGLSCPGGRETDPKPNPFDTNATIAYGLRKEAFQHRVNARYMEDRISEKDLTRAQWQAQVAYFKEFRAFVDRLNRLHDRMAPRLSSVWSSDFREVQREDLNFQNLRLQYQTLSGMAPSMALPARPPPPKPLIGTGGTLIDIPWTPVLIIGGLVAATYFLRSGSAAVSSVRGSSAPSSDRDSASERLDRNKERVAQIQAERSRRALPARSTYTNGRSLHSLNGYENDEHEYDDDNEKEIQNLLSQVRDAMRSKSARSSR